MRPTVDFLLNHWLNVANLTSRPRFAEHSSETFNQVLDTCEKIARDKFAPFNRLVDTDEPRFDGERVILPQATKDAADAYAASGMLSAAQDFAIGGMQLPYTVELAANAFFSKASVSINASLLSVGNANLLMAHGTAAQQQVFALNTFSGRFSGTMCLSEPQAGSSLSDVATRAVPDGADFAADALGPRYRLKGNKMWISAGEHELTENIIHLVLAKIPGPDGQPVPGVKGISLFIVPKHLVDDQGRLTGQRNDVALAGLNHKLGWRGTTNTLLNFGEGKFTPGGQGGAVGYRVGLPGAGLRCMFHMMNEARIGVGMAATMLGMAGYEASLDYARQRPQGRPIGVASGAGPSQGAGHPLGGATPQASRGSTFIKDAAQPQVPIIEHADVKRMLLAQKAYAEGALALELYCARLVDEAHTGTPETARDAALLLEVLTPIAKSWPSEWCLEANSLAIQVHGGYGYTRDFPVEQYWRDNRLNMIHEGTHGIQALDLLGRKVVMDGGAGFKLLSTTLQRSVDQAAPVPALAAHAAALAAAWQRIDTATQAAWSTGQPVEALANATPYLQAFGHAVLAWIWLEVALAVTLAAQGKPSTTQPAMPLSSAFAQGKLQACRYFYAYELPKIDAWLGVVASRSAICRDMQDAWF